VIALKRLPAADTVSAMVSTSVFHAVQCGHWPCHLTDWPPHSVQLYIDFDLAMRGNPASGALPPAAAIGARSSASS
jgi:hypothetical protein